MQLRHISDVLLQSVNDPKRGKVEKRLVTGGCDNLVKIWKMRYCWMDLLGGEADGCTLLALA